MNQTLENRMLMLIAQAYAVDHGEISETYRTLASFDKLIEIVEIANRSGLSIERAKDIWLQKT